MKKKIIVSTLILIIMSLFAACNTSTVENFDIKQKIDKLYIVEPELPKNKPNIYLEPFEVTYSSNTYNSYSNIESAVRLIKTINFGNVEFALDEFVNKPDIAWDIVQKLNSQYSCTGFVPYTSEQIDCEPNSTFEELTNLSARKLANDYGLVHDSYEYYNEYGYTFFPDDLSVSLTVHICTEESNINNVIGYYITYNSYNDRSSELYYAKSFSDNYLQLPDSFISKDIDFKYQ